MAGFGRWFACGVGEGARVALACVLACIVRFRLV
jgi:hypothetical protein